MSTASANPASKGLIALRARGLTKRLDEEACIRTGFVEKTFYLLKDALETLDAEAPPAAERVALKAIQGKIEDMLQAISMPKGSSTEDTLRWVLSLFDAQERAGAKA